MDWNLALNVAMFAGLLYAVPTLGRSKRKDTVIVEQKLVIDSHTTRIDALEADLRGVTERANRAADAAKECETRAAEWQARYEEQRKYTAPVAVAHFEEFMKEHSNRVADRHERMIAELDRIAQMISIPPRSTPPPQ